MQFIQLFSTYSPNEDDINIKSILYDCVFTPLWEEAIYRYVPIQLTIHLLGRKVLFPIMILSSYWFAIGHGEYIENILCQGVFGMVCSYLCYKYNYITSVGLHSLWNFSCFFNL